MSQLFSTPLWMIAAVVGVGSGMACELFVWIIRSIVRDELKKQKELANGPQR